MKTLGGTKLLLFLCIGVISLTHDQVSANLKPSVKILVIGQTGSGKSTLINILLGRNIAPVGHSLSPETQDVSVYKEEINGVSVTACDTPGLRDASGQEEDYMNKIKVSCDNPDLVLFCMSMDTTRWQNDNSETIKIVTENLGQDIWKHSVLVLTHADKVTPDPRLNDDSSVIDSFNQKISEFEQKFSDALKVSGVSRKSVPVAVSAKGQKDLPGVSNWITQLLLTCLNQCSERARQERLFLTIVNNRIKHLKEVNEAEYNKTEYEQPFVFTDSLFCSLLKLNPGAWTGWFGGSQAGILLGSKYLGAKLGTFVGGPVGGLLGLVGGFGLEYMLAYVTCPSSNANEKNEL